MIFNEDDLKLSEARDNLAKKILDRLDEDIANISKMTNRELIVFHRYKQITDLED